jgi:hypothetical protein
VFQLSPRYRYRFNEHDSIVSIVDNIFISIIIIARSITGMMLKVVVVVTMMTMPVVVMVILFLNHHHHHSVAFDSFGAPLSGYWSPYSYIITICFIKITVAFSKLSTTDHHHHHHRLQWRAVRLLLALLIGQRYNE